MIELVFADGTRVEYANEIVARDVADYLTAAGLDVKVETR